MAEALLGGRTAVVTGARRGIGAAIAEALLRHGARVVLCGRDRVGVEERVAALHAHGLDGAVAFAGDLATESARAALLERAERVDVLVNNAGGFLRAGTTLDTTPNEWAAQLQANLTLPYLLCRAVLPGMVQRRWGRIVNIGSVVATAPQPGNAIGYVAAKAGLVGFTRQLATEVAPFGVTANVVNPGTVATEHITEYFTASPQVDVDGVRARIPVGRLARPAEIAALVPFLVSDDGGFTTGAAIDVHGGVVQA